MIVATLIFFCLGEGSLLTGQQPAESPPSVEAASPDQATPSKDGKAPLLLPKSQEIRPTSIEGIPVRELPSGLKLWQLEKAEGTRPTPDSLVLVHYTGWLEDGRVYTTTREQEAATTINLRRSIIRGLAEGITYMRKGELFRLEVPPSLAFGERGYLRRVPPNETLTFEIELIDVMLPPKPSSREGKEPIKTESGLIYWDIKVGEGATVEPGSMVGIRFSRWTMSGVLVDTSEFEDQHANVLLSQVIPGWREGITGMKVGGIRQMQIPPALAFGEAGWKPHVGSQETIVSEVQVVSARSLKPRPKGRAGSSKPKAKREKTPDAYKVPKE
ncbi:MAG: FKBP-type peptidyl-prolyl cis-trans isomerase [Phycisphaerae bacterium]